MKRFIILSIVLLVLAGFAINSSAADGVILRAAPSGPDWTTTSNVFTNIEDIKVPPLRLPRSSMSSGIITEANSDLKITFSGEVHTSGGKRMFVRALVDGQPANPSDVVFAQGGFAGTRSFTFTKKNLGEGGHWVEIQWLTDPGGTAHIGDGTLTLCSSSAVTKHGRVSVKAAPSGPDKFTTSIGWVDIPDMSSSIATASNSNLEITFSGEVNTSGGKRMFVRALVDGQLANPSDVVFAQGGFTGTHSFTFTKKNLGAGSHSIKIQWLTDSGGTAHIGDRTLSLNYWQRQVPDLSKPFYSLKPVIGKRKVLVILWDPQRPSHPAPSKSAVENLICGSKPSVSDYFLENSGGRFKLECAGVLGWYDADKPADHYWKHPNTPCTDGFIHGHVEKWAEAIRKADQEFNYKKYDINNDNILSPDELAILIVIPQNDPFGTQRGVVGKEYPNKEPLIVDGVKINDIVEAYIGSPPSLGLVAHELSHILLGTGDMYFYFFQPYAAGPYSLMDQSPPNPSHLDPFHKLRLGWLVPKIITSDGEYKVRDVETHHEVYILYDPSRGDKEYYIIENRWSGNSYDSYLPDTGLAVWHIIEDPNIFNTLPTPPSVNSQQWNNPKWKGWARRAIRMIRPIYGPPYNNALWDGSDPQTGYDLLSVDPNPNHVTLKWADGTPSGFSIQSIPNSSSEMGVNIKVK
jgi:M6 family metalloprotease-like protein